MATTTASRRRPARRASRKLLRVDDPNGWPDLPAEFPFTPTQAEVEKVCERFGPPCVAERMTFALLKFSPQELLAKLRDMPDDIGNQLMDCLNEAREESEKTLEMIKHIEARVLVAGYHATARQSSSGRRP